MLIIQFDTSFDKIFYDPSRHSAFNFKGIHLVGLQQMSRLQGVVRSLFDCNKTERIKTRTARRVENCEAILESHVNLLHVFDIN